MALRFNSPFSQRDVRETPSATVTGTNKTSYMSFAGIEFTARHPSTEDVEKGAGAVITMTDASIILTCPVHLPQGAVVTAGIVHSNVSTELWYLNRASLTNGLSTAILAQANLNTEDTSISDATIDNSLYSYYLSIQVLDATDEIDGALITYTTDYI